MPEVIIGIDPGYGRCGFGLIRANATNGFAYITCGVMTTHKDIPHTERLAEIARDFRSLIAAHKPNILVIEELFFAKSTTTALKVAEVRGIILMLAHEAGLTVVEVKPNEVKMALTGFGRADKRQIQEMVKAIFGLTEVPKPDDAADALAIAWTGAGKARFDVVK